MPIKYILLFRAIDAFVTLSSFASLLAWVKVVSKAVTTGCNRLIGTKMQHSQSDVALGTNGSWADLKMAEGLKKRSNTAQNLQFYGTNGLDLEQ